MSTQQSNLSAPQYGYDFVVATTEAAVNSTLFQYLAENTFPLISQYYWLDQTNSPAAVDLNTLMTTPVSRLNPSGTNGVDPGTVANWDGSGTPPQGITDLDNSSFISGFVAQIGIPPGFAFPGALNPSNLPVLPNVVSFDSTGANVIFNLYCSSFQVFEATWERGIVSYNNQSQQAGAAWYIQTTIPINKVLNGGNIPQTVQDALTAKGDGFSIQTLFMDMDNAVGVNPSTINFGGIQPGSNTQQVLAKVFSGLYLSGLNGMPALNYNILNNNSSGSGSSLTVGQVALQYNAFIPQQGQGPDADLNTLNYVCSEGQVLPPLNAFNWNWFDVPGQYDGIAAINKNALINYFQPILEEWVQQYIFAPTVRVTAHSGWKPSDDYTSYSFSFPNGPYCSPDSTPQTGTLLSFTWQSPTSHDRAGLDGALGQAWVSSAYSLTLAFNATSIVVEQQFSVYVSADGTFGIGNSYNPIDKIIQDTYTLGVNEGGQLSLSLSSVPTDNSQTPNLNWFKNFLSSDMNDLCTQIDGMLQGFFGTSLVSVPISLMDSFVFPGGNTFTYANPIFSDNLDLVACITYTDPSY